MLQGVKNIIFDLGGVIYAIDYHKTIDAFVQLGIDDFEGLYAKAGQSALFDDLETGKISIPDFVDRIQELLSENVTQEQVVTAWNSMLLDFMPDALACVKQLSQDYRLFLLSNTNEMHIAEIKHRAGEDAFESFSQSFEKLYLSHDLGLRKPHAKVFTHILNEQGLRAEETLFIDDSIQHIEGAQKVGLKVHHLKDAERISQLLP